MKISDVIDGSKISGLQLGVVGICFFLNVSDGFDVVAISYAAPSISQAWQIDAALLGIVFSAGLLGMTLGAMFLAPLTDVIGRQKMIIAALAVVSVTMAFTALAEHTWQLIMLRAMTGLGIGSMLASMTSMVAEFVPDRRRNFAIGILQAGYPVGATGGGFLAAWMIPEFGWQSLFLVGAFFNAVMIPVVLIWLPESLEFLTKRQPAEALSKVNHTLKRMGHQPLSALPEPPVSLPKAHVGSLLTTEFRASTLLLWTAFFMCFFTIYFLISWVPKIIVDTGFTLQEGISGGITYNAGSFFGVVALGYLADKFGLRRMIVGFLVIGAIAMLAFGQSPNEITVLWALAALIGVFLSGGFAGLYSVAARIYPAEIRTTGVGWGIGAGRFGGIAGPYVGGLLIAAGVANEVSFSIFAAPLVIAALAVFAMQAPQLKPLRPLDQTTQP